jgi:hypothetical protein
MAPVNLLTSCHCPEIIGRSGSDVVTSSPVSLLRSVSSGRSGVRFDASVRPRFSGAETE